MASDLLLTLNAGAKVVAAHLGSGAGLRALDAGVILHLMGPSDLNLEQIETMLYLEGGLPGVSGIAADSRELIASDRTGAVEAVALFYHRIAGEVARLATALLWRDAVVFAAGIGVNQPGIGATVAGFALTHLNAKARPGVESVAKDEESTLFLPCDMREPDQLEAVFERIGTESGGSISCCAPPGPRVTI